MRHRITIDEIPAAGATFNVDSSQAEVRTSLVEALDGGGEHECVAELKIERKDRRVHIDGRIAGELRLACGRCASEFGFPFDRELHAVLVQEQASEADTQELELADLDESYLDGNEVDLLELTREQVLLAMPNNPLCREDCRGLCHRCGVDLNHETCSCMDDTVDPRLSVLADLKLDDES